MTDFLFSGCTIQSRLPFIEAAFKFIAEKINVEVRDIPGATCCMEPVGLRSISNSAWLSVNERMRTSASGKSIITLCEGCNLSLSESGEIINSDSKVSGTLQFLFKNLEKIEQFVQFRNEKKMAMFPGCHCEYVCSKEGSSAMDMMESVLSVIGAEPMQVKKDLCCGGGVTGIDQELDSKILNEATDSFKATGAECVVTSCPFCFLRFDMIGKLKTYHIAELIAIAMGFEDTTKYHLSK
jgi:Heterodisulfide reductase, subunit B